MEKNRQFAKRLVAHYLACVEAEDRRSLQFRREDLNKRFIAPWEGQEVLLHPGNDICRLEPKDDTVETFLASGVGDVKGPDMGYYGFPLLFDAKGRLSPLFTVPVTVERVEETRDQPLLYRFHRSEKIMLNRYLFAGYSDDELDAIQQELESDEVATFSQRLKMAMEHFPDIADEHHNSVIEPFPKDIGMRWVITPIFLRDVRGVYTYNLRQDLAGLVNYESQNIAGTALSRLWSEEEDGQKPAKQEELAELLQLNQSQQDAANAVLKNSLTVITGPPGTGKSQVVVDLLATSILEQRPVLFSSKNNQAVDVVRQRLRAALGEEFDFTLRAGSRSAMDTMMPEISDRLVRLKIAGPPRGEGKARAELKRLKAEIAQLLEQDEEVPAELMTALNEATIRLCRAFWGKRLYNNSDTVLRLLQDYHEALEGQGGRGRAYIQSVDRVATAQQKLAEYLPVWITTALSVRNSTPLRAGQFDLVVMDEASQCDVASAIPLLFRARRAAIIGDKQQLRHIPSISVEVEETLPDSDGLLPDWSYQQYSLFDLAARAFKRDGNGEPLFLKEHYRSHPDIISISNNHFYEGRLALHTDLERMESKLSEEEQGVFWFDVQGTVPATSRSAYNEGEISAVVRYVRSLRERYGTTLSIGIVTPFRAQSDRLKQQIARARLYSKDGEKLRVGTAYTFQGDESDIIIFSPVISEGIRPSALRWVATNEALLNVTITRARAALHIVGDRAACAKAGGPLAALVEHARITESLIM